MRIFDLVAKDLKQLARDWKSATFLVVMPIAFTLLFGFVFRGAGAEEDARLPVAVVDQDGSTVSAHLRDMLAASAAVRPVVPDPATAGEQGTGSDLAVLEEQVAGGELAAVVVVPADYGQAALAGDESRPPALTLIADTSSAAGQAASSAVQAAASRLMGAAQTARLTARAYEAGGGTADAAFLDEALVTAVAAWAEPPLAVESTASGALAAAKEEQPQANPYTHSSAGIMVQFAMAGLMGAAEIMLLERKTGALRRLLTTAMSRGQIILGHFLTMLLMILGQLVLLILFGDLLLGVDYLRAPLAIVLMVVTIALWTASLGLLIGVVARKEEHVIMISLMTMLIMSGLGGAWMPLEFTGQAFQTVGHLMPTAWAIDGLENITMRGLGLSSVLLPAVILLAFAAAFSALAIWRFRFEEGQVQ